MRVYLCQSRIYKNVFFHKAITYCIVIALYTYTGVTMKHVHKICYLGICLAFFCLHAADDIFAKSTPSKIVSGKEALQLLKENNALFQKSLQNTANISLEKRQKTQLHGQHPYAIIITCADSRVPPEHIFSAGIGELFVIRNAGNIIGAHEIGSIEYAVEHLHVKLIVVLGHTHCGAVGAALTPPHSPKEPSQLNNLVQHIHRGIAGEKDPRSAEKKNIQRSLQNIIADPTLHKLIKEHAVDVQGALYFIDSGAVEFLPMTSH